MATAEQNGVLGINRTNSTLPGTDQPPQLYSRCVPEYDDIERDNVRAHDRPQPTLVLATPSQEGGAQEKDCGKCIESGSKNVLVINSNVYGDPTCPQKTQARCSSVNKAIKDGDLDSLEYHQDEILSSTDLQGRNAFHLACWYGQFVVLEFLSNIFPDIVTAIDSSGWSALHYACDSIHPQLDIVKYLVENLYLDLRQQTVNGNAPIVLAKFRGHTTVINYLVNIMKELGPTEPKDQRPVLLVRDYDFDESCPSLPDREHPNGDRNMNKLENRLYTFTMGPGSWPRAHPTERQLAEQGFMYLGVEERVMCFCCKAVVELWDDGVDPLIKHYKKNPTCQFLMGNFRLRIDQLLSQQRIQHFNPQYASNSSRLYSFQDWPYSSIVSSYKLASVGFYWLGRGGKVQCFSCGVIYERWLRGDIPMEIHKRLSPNCPFLKSLQPQATPTPQPSNTLQHIAHRIPTAIHKPDYENRENRLKSFKQLSKSFPVSPQECADAGLFFVRKPDVMQCFKCDVIVRGWVVGDVAVEKHREVSPQCKFLKECFPTKLDKDYEYDSVTVDPSSLPEPLYTQEDLEEMASKEHNLLPEMSNLSLQPSYSYSSQQTAHSAAYNHPQTRRLDRYFFPEYSPGSSESSGYVSGYPSIQHTQETTMEELSDTTQVQRRHFQQGYDLHHGLNTPTHGVNYQHPTSFKHTSSLPAKANSTQDDSKLCVVCMDNSYQVALVPCGHLCVCEPCSKLITQCPMCRHPTSSTMKVYLP